VVAAGRPGRWQPPGAVLINSAAPGIGGGDAVADQLLAQQQIRKLALLNTRTQAHLGPSSGRSLPIEP